MMPEDDFDFIQLEQALKDARTFLTTYLAKGCFLFKDEVREIREDIYRLEDRINEIKSDFNKA
jgi:hypothetical protein